MEIILYKMLSDNRKINKQITDEVILNGTMREESSIMEPSFLVESTNSIITFNYVRIPEWERYYYIQNIDGVRKNLYRLTLREDVLMSWRSYVMGSTGIVDRSENFDPGNPYIDEGLDVIESRKITQVIAASGSFPAAPNYILITAGGVT